MNRILRMAVAVSVMAAAIAFPASVGMAETAMITDRHGVPAGGMEENTPPFALFGLAWNGEAPHELSVRFRDSTGWGQWQPVAYTHDHAAEPHEAPDEGLAPIADDEPGNHFAAIETVTEPIWVGEAQGYELRHDRRPTDLEVVLVRRGAKTLKIDTAPEAADAALSIAPRSSWGARPGAGEIEIHPELNFAVVHHTAFGSTVPYSRDEVPAILRSIQSYHMDANGWDDIGYNFLIDRFGRVWEGRDGGTDQVVVGAHARNWNEGSSGVALLGDFQTNQPSLEALASLDGLLHWKLAQHGVDVASTVTLEDPVTKKDRTFKRILGHRDLGTTACPGDLLSGRIVNGQISTTAVGSTTPPAPKTDTPSNDNLLSQASSKIRFDPRTIRTAAGTEWITGDFDGDSIDDVIWGKDGRVSSIWYGTSRGRFEPVRAPFQVWNQPLVGDFDGDGDDDVLWYGAGGLADSLWFDNGRLVKQASVNVRGTYENPLVGDFDGNGVDDIIWHTASTAKDYAWWFRTDGRWNWSYTPQATGRLGVVGDIDGDGRDDVYWHGPGETTDLLWFGEAKRAFDERDAVNVRSAVTPLLADTDGDGRADLLWQSSIAWDGLWLARGDGGFSPTPGFSRPGPARLVPADLNGDDRVDLLRIDDSGSWQVAAAPALGTEEASGKGLGGLVPLIGDFDGDWRDDILWVNPGTSGSQIWLTNS